MPIRLILDDPSRMIVGVATGTLTVQELIDFLREFLAAGKTSYRKIIDFSACEPAFDKDGLEEFMKLRGEIKPGVRTGPLALVIGDHQDRLTRLFADQTGEDRPANVFRTIHEARRWLADHSAPEKQRAR